MSEKATLYHLLFMKMDDYKTSETELVAAIVSQGISIESMSKDERGRVYFYFQRDTLLDQIIRNYWSKTLPIDAQTLLHEYRFVKQRIFNFLREN